MKTKTKEIRGPEGQNNIAVGPRLDRSTGLVEGLGRHPQLNKAAKKVKQASANLFLFHRHSEDFKEASSQLWREPTKRPYKQPCPNKVAMGQAPVPKVIDKKL